MFTQNNDFHIKQDTVISTGLYRRKSGPSQDHTDPDITQSKQEVEASRGPVNFDREKPLPVSIRERVRRTLFRVETDKMEQVWSISFSRCLKRKSKGVWVHSKVSSQSWPPSRCPCVHTSLTCIPSLLGSLYSVRKRDT